MDKVQLISAYSLVSELILHPKDRNESQIKDDMAQLGDVTAPIRVPLDTFLATPLAASHDEYVSTLELTPLIPLYLGTHIFSEPDSCRGAGMSGRNGYMLELRNIYRHFGVEFAGSEMTDFVPVIIEFLGISLKQQEKDQIGLRRYLLETLLKDGFETLQVELEKRESPYALLIKALLIAMTEDISQLATTPKWEPPPREQPAQDSIEIQASTLNKCVTSEYRV